MPILESLYRLSARDESSSWLDVQPSFEESSQNAVQIIVSRAVPKDKILFTASMVAEFEAGAAQALEYIFLGMSRANDLSLPVFRFDAFDYAGAAAFQRAVLPTTEMIPGGFFVIAVGNFSAAVAPNIVRLSVIGTLVPKGNVLF